MMKQLKVLSILFSLALLIGLSACSDDDDKREIKEYQLTVASVKRIMLNPDHFSPYFVKHEGEDKWKSFQYITNFSHEEGYEYVVRVRVERVVFEDMIGGSPYETTLLEVVSKVKKDSENIPIQKSYLMIASKKTGDESKPFYAKNKAMDPWRKIPPIEGFEHEEGYEYQIVVDCVYNGFGAEERYSFTFSELDNKIQRTSTGLPM